MSATQTTLFSEENCKPCKQPRANALTSLSERLLGGINPLPSEVVDTKQIQGILPYAQTQQGKTAVSLLKYYYDLSVLSPTLSACIEKKTLYAFGGKVNVVRAVNPLYAINNKGIKDSEQIMVFEQLDNLLFETNIQDFFARMALGISWSGYTGFEVTLKNTLGVITVSLQSYQPYQIALADRTTKEGEVDKVTRKAVIVKSLFSILNGYHQQKGNRDIDIYPKWTETNVAGEVQYKTFVFIKNENAVLYGRPQWQGASQSAYQEVANQLYLIKAAANNYGGTNIMEVENAESFGNYLLSEMHHESAKENGYKDAADMVRGQLSAEGENKGLWVISRPPNSKEFKLASIPHNLNESYHKFLNEDTAQKIIQANQVTRRFLGHDVSNGFSSQVYQDDFRLNVEPAIQALKNKLLFPFNMLLSDLAKDGILQHFDKYAIDFEYPVSMNNEFEK